MKTIIQKPQKLFHGSKQKVEGPFRPILNKSTLDHIHEKAAIFATEREDVAALFTLPLNILHSIGFEQDIPYICIWGTPEEFAQKENEIKGYLYTFASDNFEKIGKDYEWQSFKEVIPIEERVFNSIISDLMNIGVQIYFINDDPLFDRVVEEKDNRAPFLKDQISENQKKNINIKLFK